LQSSKGEVRRVPLPDGSNVTLNTQSLVKVRYTRHARAVSLTERRSAVQRRRGRPSALRRAGGRGLAAGRQRQLLGSSRRARAGAGDGPGREGRDDLPGREAPLLLAANAAVLRAGRRRRPDRRAGRLDADEVARRLAWQDGLLAFNGESLAQAAASSRAIPRPGSSSTIRPWRPSR
jgi:transmembrane sensor